MENQQQVKHYLGHQGKPIEYGVSTPTSQLTLQAASTIFMVPEMLLPMIFYNYTMIAKVINQIERVLRSVYTSYLWERSGRGPRYHNPATVFNKLKYHRYIPRRE